MDVVLRLMVIMDHEAPWPEDSNTGKKKGGSQARHGAPCLCCSALDYTNEKRPASVLYYAIVISGFTSLIASQI